jgi:hypothetical protein
MIPLGLALLIVGALLCWLCYANARAILQREDEEIRAGQRPEIWNWPDNEGRSS